MQVSKINEVHLKVETEPSIARELADYFTFEVPGHRFMPAYKNKVWDGKIRLYSIWKLSSNRFTWINYLWNV